MALHFQEDLFHRLNAPVSYRMLLACGVTALLTYGVLTLGYLAYQDHTRITAMWTALERLKAERGARARH